MCVAINGATQYVAHEGLMLNESSLFSAQKIVHKIL